MSDPHEIVQYLVFRLDLPLSRGKAAAQAGHALQLAIRSVERDGSEEARRWLAEWERVGIIPKIALCVPDLAQLEALRSRLADGGVVHSWVVDAGRTELEPGTVTVMGLQPMPR